MGAGRVRGTGEATDWTASTSGAPAADTSGGVGNVGPSATWPVGAGDSPEGSLVPGSCGMADAAGAPEAPEEPAGDDAVRLGAHVERLVDGEIEERDAPAEGGVAAAFVWFRDGSSAARTGDALTEE